MAAGATSVHTTVIREAHFTADSPEGPRYTPAGGSPPAALPAPSFLLKASSARALFSAASALYSHKKDQYATLAVNSKGLRLVVENTAKSLHAIAALSAPLFDVFTLPLVRGEHTEVAFRVNVWTLLECLMVYGAAALPTAQLTLAYDAGRASELTVLLVDGGAVAESTLRTVDLTTLEGGGGEGGEGGESNLEAAFQAAERPVRVVLKSDALHDVIRDVCDAPGAASVVVTATPEGGGALSLHTSTPGGTLTIDIPATSAAVVSSNVGATLSFSYHVKLLESSLRALAGSFQTMVRLNTAGVLSITHRLDPDREGGAGAAGAGGGGALVTTLIMPEEASEDLGGGGAAEEEGGGGAKGPRTEYVEESQGGGAAAQPTPAERAAKRQRRAMVVEEEEEEEEGGGGRGGGGGGGGGRR